MLLLAGCQSNQQVSCQQEKQKLEETVRTQQAEIDGLRQSVKGIGALLSKVTVQLQQCKEQGLKAQGAKEQNPKVTKRVERRRPSRTRTNPKPRPKTSTTKKTSGCPCKRRRQTK